MTRILFTPSTVKCAFILINSATLQKVFFWFFSWGRYRAPISQSASYDARIEKFRKKQKKKKQSIKFNFLIPWKVYLVKRGIIMSWTSLNLTTVKSLQDLFLYTFIKPQPSWVLIFSIKIESRECWVKRNSNLTALPVLELIELYTDT
jgi:hypothetical protein